MVNEINDLGIRYVLTRPAGGDLPAFLNDDTARQVHRFHTTVPGYQPTRLVRLAALARRWGVGGILVKDESTRFGLKAFKGLGGSYAVARLICRTLGIEWGQVGFGDLAGDAVRRRIGPMTLATATDGNHGRGVAWTAEQLGLKAVIYMP